MGSGRFIDVLVEEHEALPDGCGLRFHALGDDRPVGIIRWETTVGGDDRWTIEAIDADGARRPATATLVDDSSAGTSLLLWGGEHGVRLRPADAPESEEIAEPYLLLDVDAAVG